MTETTESTAEQTEASEQDVSVRRNVYFDAATLTIVADLQRRGGLSLSHVVRQALWREAESRGLPIPV